MTYEIFTHGGGEYIIEVLNAIVRIIGSNTFTTALRLSLFFGLVAIFADVAINGDFTKTIKYYFSFFLAYNILFLPKVDVLVVDPITIVRNDRRIDNIPFSLALTAHIVSSLGNWLTNIFEMNFSLPEDLQYNRNGLLFGSTLIEKALSAKISDSRVKNNFNNFIKQCVVLSINLKRISLEDVLNSEDLSTLLGYGSNGVLAYEFTNRTGQTINRLCKDTNNLKIELGTEINKIIRSQINENIRNTSDNALKYILGIQESTTELFEQTLLMNAIEDSTQEYLAMVGANAGATNYAITKDDLQRKQTGILQWLQANKYLPLLKITIEVLFYGLFPIVILMTMLPSGFKVFKSYLMILLSLQMWAPMYAILNLIMTLLQKFRINLLLVETGNRITLYNRQAILNISQGIMTQAGVLAWSIPILSYKVIGGMQGFAEGLNGIAQAGAFTTNQVASDVASGNLSYGNGSFRNTSWGNDNFNNTNGNKFDTDIVRNYGKRFETGDDGIMHAKYSDGFETTNISRRLSSDLGFSFKTSQGQINSDVLALSQAKTMTETRANSYSKSLQELESFSFADSKTSGKIHSLSNSNLIKGNVGIRGGIPGIGGAGIDIEKTMTWADSHNISTEDRKTLNNLLDRTKQQQISYNQAFNEQQSKQKSLNYSRNTSMNSDFNANNEVERHLREDLGWNQDKIDHIAKHEPQIISTIARDHLSNRVFTPNKPGMLDSINNSIGIAKDNYINQNNNMIDKQYNYNKNNLNKENSLRMFRNTNLIE